MAHFLSDESKMVGLPPGTIVHIGEASDEAVRFTVFAYSEALFTEREAAGVDECFPLSEDPRTVTWINIDGVHDPDVIRAVGARLELHPLVLEDIANTTQRPKLEDYGEYLFVTLKMLHLDEDEAEVWAEQVSFVLTDRCVVSFQEFQGDMFDPIRERLRKNKGRVRKSGPDYLLYALLDALIDHYFVILAMLGEGIDRVQDRAMDDPSPATLGHLNHLSREVLFLRKHVWPAAAILHGLMQPGEDLVTDTTRSYLRDARDHLAQVVDTVGVYRDMLSGLMDVYLSSLSLQMNRVMKVLAIITAIFIPLSFVVGFYGQNFAHLPGASHPLAAWITLAALSALAGGMLLLFRRAHWI